MESMDVEGRDPLVVLEEALKGGITCFQLCEQGTGWRELAAECKSLCDAYGVPFIVNGDIDLAIEIGADGIHIEHGDVSSVKERIGPDMLLGITVQTASEAFVATDIGANYIAVGPLFESKTDRHVGGLELVREIAFQLPGLPIVGFGGISERKISSVIRAGASGVAVTSAITEDEHPEEAARRLKGQALLSLTGVEM